MTERRVYTPPLDAEPFAGVSDDGDGRRKMMVFALMAIIIGAVAVVSWNTYGRSGAPPLISVADQDFKTMAPAPAGAAPADRELYDVIEGDKQTLTTRAASADEAPLAPEAPKAAEPPVAPAAPEASPSLIVPSAPLAQGPFVVQLAALRSREAAEQSWAVFGARAPGLARNARLDIQRADLGAQGIFFRLRAGYFDTRERAGAYCAKAKEQGQECMVVVR